MLFPTAVITSAARFSIPSAVSWTWSFISWVAIDAYHCDRTLVFVIAPLDVERVPGCLVLRDTKAGLALVSVSHVVEHSRFAAASV